MHLRKYFLVYLFAASIVAILGIAFANQTAITKQLDSWQLLPHSQGVTELYFVDDKQLPVAAKVDSIQNVAFTIRNLEHETTMYRYKLVATEEGAVSGQSLTVGTVRLGHNESRTMNEIIKMPLVKASRVAISVEIEYQGMPFGNKTLNAQRQAIQYWVTIAGRPV